MADSYKEVKVFEFDNAVVRVHIPDLTEEERSRRMNRIKAAAENMMKGIEREKCKGLKT